jgi:hypothetical protein
VPFINPLGVQLLPEPIPLLFPLRKLLLELLVLGREELDLSGKPGILPLPVVGVEERGGGGDGLATGAAVRDHALLLASLFSDGQHTLLVARLVSRVHPKRAQAIIVIIINESGQK